LAIGWNTLTVLFVPKFVLIWTKDPTTPFGTATIASGGAAGRLPESTGKRTALGISAVNEIGASSQVSHHSQPSTAPLATNGGNGGISVPAVISEDGSSPPPPRHNTLQVTIQKETSVAADASRASPRGAVQPPGTLSTP
jgi:hypothetical protein